MPDSPDPLEPPMSKLIYSSINALHIDIQNRERMRVCVHIIKVVDGTKIVHTNSR